ncbi:MAG: response regulator [Opitutales bacterium]|nr:response regulator [Opitutales bacterium]MCH8540051.1 response regulator [Opitutales bacterium]
MAKEPVILIVDDDLSILKIFSFALNNADYRTLTASDADQAIELARKHLPDVILSDINMPGTDGRSFLRNLRSDPDLAATQFVLMTGNTRDMDARAGMEVGADDFLCKPFNVSELCRCIEARLARTRIHWRVEDRMIKELKNSLYHTLPHEFFTPLAGVIGIADILHSDWSSFSKEEIKDMTLQISKSGWRLHRTLRNYLNTINPSFPNTNAYPGPELLTSEELGVKIQSGARETAEKHVREADIRFDLNPPSLTLNLELLLILLQELVENACSFSKSGTPIQIAFSPDGKLSITDQGRGMSEDQINRINSFRQFEREYYEQQGLGLGLTTARQIAEAHQANFFIQSETGKGTTVTVSFPISPEHSPAK